MKVSPIQIKRELTRRSLKYFIQFTFETYVFNWHHLHMISVLDRFIRGDIKKLMIYMPPQHGKSEIVSRRVPAYMLGLKPTTKIAACSYSYDLARKFNRSVQRIMSEKSYIDLFPATMMPQRRLRNSAEGSYTRNTDEFEIVGHGGSYKSIGVMGGLTGNPVDVGIIDDPVKDSLEAQSERYRNRVWEWYNEVFMTRLHNDSQVLLTMTRWHEDDLAGRIYAAEKGDWHVISFPAVKEDNENPDDPRLIGQPLWPERHSLEKLMKQKSNSERTWASLFQQRPAPLRGNIIRSEWFNRVDDFGGIYRYYLDSAYTSDGDNDPSCLMEYTLNGDSILITRVFRFWLDFPQLCDKISQIISNPHSVLTVEPKASGKSIVQYLRNKANFIVHEDKPPKDSKIARCHSATPFMESGSVGISPGDWNDAFLAECNSFPNGKHDDQVDCLVAIIRKHLLSRFRNDDMTGMGAFDGYN